MMTTHPRCLAATMSPDCIIMPDHVDFALDLLIGKELQSMDMEQQHLFSLR